MSEEFILPLWTVLLGWMIAGGSPGPATLSISGTSMAFGRAAGLQVAAGVVVGSASWGVAAGLGFSALMMAHVWLFELIRYAGAGYLLWLAIKSLRSAWAGGPAAPATAVPGGLFFKGLLLHLTNPKAILSWGAIYAVALTPGAGASAVWSLFAVLIMGSMVVFFGYAMLFAARPVAVAYSRARRWFDLAFGMLFGAASVRILTARLT